MATLTTVAYGLIVRWRLGVLNGASVEWSRLTTADDGAQSEVPLGPEPVDIGQGKGFPLADILNKVAADSLVMIAGLEATIAAKDADLAAAASEKSVELAAKDTELAAVSAAKNAELAAAATAHAAEKAAKDAELVVKAEEIAAENAVATAAKALAAKIAEVAAVKKDGPERAAKEAEAAQLAAQVAAKDAELAFVKLPEKERNDQKIRDEIARLEEQLNGANKTP